MIPKSTDPHSTFRNLLIHIPEIYRVISMFSLLSCVASELGVSVSRTPAISEMREDPEEPLRCPLPYTQDPESSVSGSRISQVR